MICSLLYRILPRDNVFYAISACELSDVMSNGINAVKQNNRFEIVTCENWKDARSADPWVDEDDMIILLINPNGITTDMIVDEHNYKKIFVSATKFYIPASKIIVYKKGGG